MSYRARLDAIQARAVEWHTKRFPAFVAERVALKLCEEAGEVGRAVNDMHPDSATGRGDVPSEAGDVLIALLVLLGRWFPDADLLVEAERKLDILTDCDSGHPSAAAPPDRHE